MMSLPDFREKHIAFIKSNETDVSSLRFKNENICIERDGKIINQVSCHKLLAAFIIGDATLTTNLIREANELGVSLYLMKSNFLCYSPLVAEAAGNYLLRQKQYTTSLEKEMEISKHIVKNKIKNQIDLVRERKINPAIDFETVSKGINVATENEQILGIEGSSTKEFFSAYFCDIGWYRRLPRAKPDEINVLLDLGYTMLFNMVDALLSLHGFDTYKGVYHKLFFQRKSLACDVMEPFRCIIDRQLLKSFNLKQVKKEDFRKTKTGVEFTSYDLQRKYLSIFSEVIMERKEDIFSYVRSYYYYILNDTDEFPEFNILK